MLAWQMKGNMKVAQAHLGVLLTSKSPFINSRWEKFKMKVGKNIYKNWGLEESCATLLLTLSKLVSRIKQKMILGNPTQTK